MTLKRRLTSHMKPNPTAYSGKWVHSILAKGKIPIIRLIEQVGNNWPERERHWIAHYRDMGCKLTNLVEGGRGPDGYAHTECAKQKISDALRKRIRDPESSARIAKTLTGHATSEETRKKISDATKLHFQSDERKSKQSAALKKFSASEAGKIHIANMVKNRPPISDATRKKLSEAGKARYASPEERAKRSESQKLAWKTSRQQKPFQP